MKTRVMQDEPDKLAHERPVDPPSKRRNLVGRIARWTRRGARRRSSADSRS
jgi:hypothetical protein